MGPVPHTGTSAGCPNKDVRTMWIVNVDQAAPKPGAEDADTCRWLLSERLPGTNTGAVLWRTIG